MNLLLVGLIQFAIATLVVGIAALKLASLRQEPGILTAFVPIANVVFLAEMLGLERGIGVILALFLLGLPYSILLVLPFLAGRYASRTGRPTWLGWLLSVPPLTFLGILIVAATARRVQPGA